MGYKNIHKEPKANTNGFDKNPQNIGNKKPSIKKQLLELLENDGELKIDAGKVLRIEDDGSIIIKLTTQMQLAMKLQDWALSKKGIDSLKAIQMIMEQVDGKPKQNIGLVANEVKPILTKRDQ